MNQPTNYLEKDELEKVAKTVNKISKMLPSLAWFVMRDSAKTAIRTKNKNTYHLSLLLLRSSGIWHFASGSLGLFIFPLEPTFAVLCIVYIQHGVSQLLLAERAIKIRNRRKKRIV